MKRAYLGFLLSATFVIALILSFATSNNLHWNVNAQAPTPWKGEYGFTYNIYPPGELIRQYNILGETKYVGSLVYFQTYAQLQFGPTISSFDILRLRGRVWWQGERGCPLNLVDDLKYHWQNAHGGYGAHYLIIQQPPSSVFPKYGVSNHQLVEPYAENLQGNPPSMFRVWTYSNPQTGTASPAVWGGHFFQC